MCKLKLKGESFSVFTAAYESNMKELWIKLTRIWYMIGNTGKKSSELSCFVKFLSHCCQVRHYLFTIKKHCYFSCLLCRPAQETFNSLFLLPDPISREKVITVCMMMYPEHQPQKSLGPACKLLRSKQTTMPFSLGVQNLKNADTMIQCEQCKM